MSPASRAEPECVYRSQPCAGACTPSANEISWVWLAFFAPLREMCLRGICLTQVIALASAWWGGPPGPRRAPSSACWQALRVNKKDRPPTSGFGQSGPPDLELFQGSNFSRFDPESDSEYISVQYTSGRLDETTPRSNPGPAHRIPPAHRPGRLLSCEPQPRPRPVRLPRLRSLRPRSFVPPRPILLRFPCLLPPRPTIPAYPRTAPPNRDPFPSLWSPRCCTFAFFRRLGSSYRFGSTCPANAATRGKRA